MSKRQEWTLETVKSRCIVDGDCWIWTMGCTNKGVAQAAIEGKCQSVARWAFNTVLRSKFRPQLKSSDLLRPSCGHPRCVSPSCQEVDTRSRLHRELAAGQDGVMRMERRRRTLIERGRIALTPSAVEAIRAAQGSQSAVALGEQYGVTPDHIRRLWRGKHWRAPQPINSVFTWAEAA